MSSSSTKTAVSHLIFVAMDPDEDSDEAEDTINVAAIDLTSAARGPGRPPSTPPVTTSSANLTCTAKRKRTVRRRPSTLYPTYS